MRCHSSRAAVLLFLVASFAASASAAGIFDHVPDNALVVAVVRNLAATDARIQQVEQIFAGLSESPLPAPLALVKAATGFGDGLNESGDALLALLPGDDAAPAPKPLLLVPVSDFASFAASIKGDPSGEISRITIASQDVLLAKRGDYALLMNLEHRPTMEALLAGQSQPSPALAEFGDWLNANDVVVVALPAAIELMTTLGAANQAQREEMERMFSDPAMGSALTGLKLGFAINDHFIAFCNSEVRAAAVGVAIDDATNVRLSKRLLLKPSGTLAAMDNVPKLAASPLAGMPAEPFVFAGGGPLPREWADAWVRLAVSFTKEARDLYGFDAFDESQWKQVEESWRLWLTETSDAIVMLAGDKEDPIISNIFNVMDVDDAETSLGATRKSIEIWNGLTAQSTNDIKLVYEPSDVEVEGKQGLLLSADVAGAAGDEENPMMKTMWNAALGPGGKFRTYVVPLDGNKVVASIGDEAQAAQAVGWLVANEQGLAQTAHVKATADLLDPASPWSLYISPHGCVAWAERPYQLMFATFGAPQMTIPPFPEGPPFGLSMNLANAQLQGEFVAPVQTLKDLAAYIKANSQ